MSSQPTILVVEDEESYIEALQLGLGREGFVVEVARSGSQALDRFDAVAPDLVLLDIMLPGVSGIDVCREIRAKSSVPIIMVTAKTSEIDTVVGLEVGADDYVSKPYRLRELVARIRAVLRRRGETPEPGLRDDVVEVGDLIINVDSREVRLRDELVSMPLKEYELLLLLMENTGRVLTRGTIIDRVWGYDYVGDTKTLDVHVKRLRAKIEDNPAQPQRLITVRGVGYKYVAV
ncbi:MAG: response regulator transcription factor [Actinobacteria bacterium]|nr:response regulator transcription factor [Actinomycetota bacterium]